VAFVVERTVNEKLLASSGSDLLWALWLLKLFRA
jgi:hypothetical protein